MNRIASSLVVFAAACSGAPAAASVWNCTARAVYALAHDGTLVPERLGRPAWKAGDRLLYDEVSGLVRIVPTDAGKSESRLTFNVWQTGSSENSAIAVYGYDGPASKPLMTLRIVTYAKGPTRPFVFTDEDLTTVTGVCENVASR